MTIISMLCSVDSNDFFFFKKKNRDLNANQLYGTIPTQLGNLQNLKEL